MSMRWLPPPCSSAAAAAYRVCAPSLPCLLAADEYRNYEKALAAMKEAAKQAGKIKEEAVRDARSTSIMARIALVDRFVTARKLAKSDPKQMVDICQQLLTQKDAETAIRVGDVYAVLVYYKAQQRQAQDAYELLEEMRTRGIAIEPFVDPPLVEEIYGAVGADPYAVGALHSAAPPGATGEEGEEVDEEIDEGGEEDGKRGR